MKKITCGILCLLVFGGGLFSQEKITVLNGALSFQRPANVILSSELPEFKKVSEMTVYLNKKILLTVGVSNEDTLREEEDYFLTEAMISLLDRKTGLTNSDLLNLSEQGNPYALIKDNLAEVSEIGSKFRYNMVHVGELSGFANVEGSEAPDWYGLRFVVVVEDYLVNVRLVLYDWDWDAIKQMPDYFFTRDNRVYYWKDDALQTRSRLFHCLLSDDYTVLPERLRDLRESFYYILETLEIPGYLPETKTCMAAANLRLRSDQNTASAAITTLPKGTEVTILEKGRMQILDNIVARWVKVESSDGSVGWCFSGYLEKVKSRRSRTVF
jgi:uncharacterized protein YgiM (DUF1202 family)